MLEVLTAEQRAKLETLMGDQFDLPTEVRGFGGRADAAADSVGGGGGDRGRDGGQRRTADNPSRLGTRIWGGRDGSRESHESRGNSPSVCCRPVVGS